MKAGIVGYAGSGKSTIFQWLTGVTPDVAAAMRGQTGVARIPDDRLNWLSAQFKPKKTTNCTLEFLDTPGLIVGDTKDNPRRLSILREADALLLILPGFEGDPVKQLESFRADIILADLEIVTNRIPKVEAQLKKNKPTKEKELDQQELEVLKRVAAVLENLDASAKINLTEADEKIVRSFQLLTLKPELVLLNQSEPGQPIPEGVLKYSPNAMAAPVKLEMELAELSEADRASFMADLGVTELVREKTLRGIFIGINRIVFLTVGEDECRSWSIAKGMNAQTASGAIHTDLMNGFVRAEVTSFEDYKSAGSFKEAKARGVQRLEGKTYIVQDGDIMNILANK